MKGDFREIEEHEAFFPPQERAIMLEDRRAIEGYKAIVNGNTGEAISVVSKRYAVVPHREAVNIVSQAVGSLGKMFDNQWGGNTGKTYLSHKGARLYKGWVFSENNEVVPGDKMDMGVRLRNSYDGSMALELDALTVRRLCENVALAKTGRYSVAILHLKHLGDREALLDALQKVMDKLVSDYHMALSTYTKAIEIILPKKEIMEIVDTFDWSKKYRDMYKDILDGNVSMIAPNWNEETIPSAENTLNLYKAFNIATYINTHMMPPLTRLNKESEPLKILERVK